MRWLKEGHQLRPSLRFAGAFVLLLALHAALFEVGRSAFASLYMVPLAGVAELALNTMGMPAVLDTTPLDHGYCNLDLGGVVYRVTFDCTGMFALVVFLSLVLAYPVSGGARLRGLLLGLPALLTFNALRLICLGVIAFVDPDWIEVFHVYVMELATLGFTLYVLKYWINHVA